MVAPFHRHVDYAVPAVYFKSNTITFAVGDVCGKYSIQFVIKQKLVASDFIQPGYKT